MKFNWMKDERDLYSAKSIPLVVKIPSHRFLSVEIDKKMTSVEIRNYILSLHNLNRAVKIFFKAQCNNDPVFRSSFKYDNYIVLPMEKISSCLENIYLYKTSQNCLLRIPQPDFINDSILEMVFASEKRKKGIMAFQNISVITSDEELCCQISFDHTSNENEVEEKVRKYIKLNNLERVRNDLYDIYLKSNKTIEKGTGKRILRCSVRRKENRL